MKLKLLSIITVFGLFACSSTSITYNPKEFDTAYYQNNVENAVDATDMLKDFDDSKIPQANLEPADFSNLVQADLYFNQGDYIKAYSYFKHLSVKHKDPRIIYKAIICIEHFSATKEQIAELDSMLDLFIKVNPDSRLAKLFQIKVALNQNNLSLATEDLDMLMKKNPQNGRVILLFVSSLITGGVGRASGETLTEFSDYVVDNYKAYPESNLLASVGYAAANNPDNLANRLDFIQNKFPNWDIPAIWSVGILAHSGNESAVIQVLDRILKNDKTPDVTLQNIYVGSLIKTKQLDRATDYTNGSIQNNQNRDNALVNMGVIKSLQKDYDNALPNFTAAQSENKMQLSMVKSVIGAIYDYQGKYSLAIKYYQEAASLNQYLVQPANIIILNDYVALGDKARVNQILDDFAKSQKLDAKKTILFKAGFYNDIDWHDESYKLLARNYTKYSADREYLYMYAGSASMSRNTKEAIKLYNKYIKTDPKNAMAYNDLAFTYADQTHDTKLAYTNARKAFALKPTDASILDTMGWVYYKQGNYDMALKYVKESIDKGYDPDSAQHLKDIYTALRQPDMAAKVVIITKDQVKANVRRQLLEKSIGLLMYIQFGIEVK
jgi:tetratricopeptide (TPR) repeat protein